MQQPEGVPEVLPQIVDPGPTPDVGVPFAERARATARPRFTARVVAVFGALTLVLATIGIYGTLSYIVGLRSRGIAIRLSLGAAHCIVVPDVLRNALKPVLAGGAAGALLAVAIARPFESLLFQVEPLDTMSIAAGAGLLLLAAITAALVPAIRVLRVDPATALRTE